MKAILFCYFFSTSTEASDFDKAYLDYVWVFYCLIINYHILSSLKQHKFIVLQFLWVGVEALNIWVLCSWPHQTEIRVLARAGVSSDAQVSFPSSHGCLYIPFLSSFETHKGCVFRTSGTRYFHTSSSFKASSESSEPPRISFVCLLQINSSVSILINGIISNHTHRPYPFSREGNYMGHIYQGADILKVI